MIAVLLLLTACAPDLSDKRVRLDTAGAMKDCANSPDSKKDDCFNYIADVLRTTNQDDAFSACAEIKDDNQKRGCFENLYRAQNSTDVKVMLCKKIIIPDMKKGCADELASKIKDANEAIALCNQITDDNNFKEHCLNEVASSSTDVTSKIAICEARTGTDKDNCLQNLGTSLFATDPAKGIEVCNKIASADMKYSCLNNFGGSPELIKKYPSYAVQICDSFTLKDNCYMNVADKLAISDPKKAAETCQKLSDEVQISNCYGNVWFISNERVAANYDFSVKLCNVLNLKKIDCFRRIASALKDINPAKAEAACKLITDSSSSGCLQDVRN